MIPIKTIIIGNHANWPEIFNIKKSLRFEVREFNSFFEYQRQHSISSRADCIVLIETNDHILKLIKNLFPDAVILCAISNIDQKRHVKLLTLGATDLIFEETPLCETMARVQTRLIQKKICSEFSDNGNQNLKQLETSTRS